MLFLWVHVESERSRLRSPRHHFLRKGAGLVSQRLVAQQNRQRGSAATGARRDVRWMERWRDGDWNDEEPVGGGTPVDWAGHTKFQI